MANAPEDMQPNPLDQPDGGQAQVEPQAKHWKKAIEGEGRQVSLSRDGMPSGRGGKQGGAVKLQGCGCGGAW